MLTMKNAGAVGEAALPVAELAGQMRLADGYDAVPGQTTRLVSRLRAAMGMVERKLGLILVERDVILTGRGPDGRRIGVGISPVSLLGQVDVVRLGQSRSLDGARLEADGRDVVLVLPEAVSENSQLTVTVTAGFGIWAAVPDEIRQAVLMIAEALDEGRTELMPIASRLIAGHRDVRIGGRR